MLKPRRSPERKRADRRLDKALTAHKVSKAERGRAHMLYGSLISHERDQPLPFTEAHRRVLADLREARLKAARTHFEVSSTRPFGDGDDPFAGPTDRYEPEQ